MDSGLGFFLYWGLTGVLEYKDIWLQSKSFHILDWVTTIPILGFKSQLYSSIAQIQSKSFRLRWHSDVRDFSKSVFYKLSSFFISKHFGLSQIGTEQVQYSTVQVFSLM